MESSELQQKTPGDASVATRLNRDWKEARAWMEPAFEKARKARAFYDSKQFTIQEENELKRQGRPAIVINLVSKAIDNICGRERASRFDWEARPIGEADVQTADFATLMLEFLENQTQADSVISDAFEDAVKGPMGWLGVNYDDSTIDQEPVQLDTIDPFEMYIDPHSRKWDLTDARYVIRKRIVDLDTALDTYGREHEQAIRNAIVRNEDREGLEIASDYGNRDDGDYSKGHESWYVKDEETQRERVALREHWWWVWEDAQVIQHPDGRVAEVSQPPSQMVMQLLMEGGLMASKRLKRFRYAVMAGPVLLYEDVSPYPFNGFPYIPVWCKRDRHGRPHGLIDIMIPAQMEVNVAEARLNESLRSRWLIYREGALGNLMESEVAQRLARANFVLPVSEPQNIQVGTDKVDAALWANQREKAERTIDEVVGNNESSYGDKDPTAKSGIAKQMQVMQQSLNLGKVFDHLKRARRTVGETFLCMAQALMPVEKWARVIEAESIQRKRPVDLSFVRGPQLASITQMRYDINITDQADTDTERQARFQQGVELAAFIPDGPPKLLYIANLMKMSDWPDADETAAMLEQFAQMMMAPPPMPGLPPGVPPNPEEGMPMAPDGAIPDQPAPVPPQVPGLSIEPPGLPLP